MHNDRCAGTNHRHGFSAIELLVVVALSGVMLAIAVPMVTPAVGGYRLSANAHDVAYQAAVAKMRAASYFTTARIYCDFSTRTYRVETWRKSGTPGWETEGGTQSLAGVVSFSFATTGTPPPNTQGTIAQAPPCRDDDGAVVANTSCVVFNSRGIPIDSTGAPVGGSVLYLSDGSAVYGTTVSATGLIQLWWTPTRTVAWQKQ